MIFEQDFSSSNTVGDYENSSATSANTTQFHEISRFQDTDDIPTGGFWSIESETLELDRTSASGFGRSNVLRRTNLDSTTLLSFQYELNVGKDSGSISFDGTSFYVGTGSIPAGGHSQRAVALKIQNSDPGTFLFGAEQLNLNQTYTYRFYGNRTAGNESYQGPDGNSHILAPDTYTFWADTTTVAEDQSFNNLTTLDAFAFDWGKPDGATWTFDNFQARNDLDLIPEPASAALLGLAALLLVSRRRRR